MPMLIATFVLALWILGMLTSYSMGGLIHVLLVVALLMFFNRVVHGPEELLQKRGDGILRKYKKS
ncbi:MAG: lmo0937 family membrane protein [Planctomycetota bacterium]